MARRLTPAEFTEKHARRLKGATEDIRAGINAVTASPTAKAADKQEKMKAKLVARIDDGTWAKRLRGVSLEDWKKQAAEVGVNRISTGIDNAKAKVESFASQLLPKVYAVADDVKKMPDLTLEDNIARMNKQIREMSKFRKS
jgi:hypothetical protein